MSPVGWDPIDVEVLFADGRSFWAIVPSTTEKIVVEHRGCSCSPGSDDHDFVFEASAEEVDRVFVEVERTDR